jgi:hypothetical protein
MKKIPAAIPVLLAAALAACSGGGGNKTANNAPAPQAAVEATPATEIKPAPAPTPEFPDLQKDLLDDRYKTTDAPIGKFDFKNYSYPLPRGWQDPDGGDAQLENGSRKMTEDKIGVNYVTTRYMDATGDGQDEAIVILKLVTAGSAIPQVVYIFEWKDSKPELIWFFRTGDRADGGLKDMRAEDGMLTVELFGQDRFLLGAVETSKITGDEEQLCCPGFFSRSRYKWNGKNFLMQGKRQTFSVADPGAAPVENMGDIVNNPNYNKQQGAKK